MKARAWFVAAATMAVAVAVTLKQEHLSARSASGIVISEYRLRGPAGANDEFIELFNAGAGDVNVSGWQLRASTNTNIVTALTTLPNGTIIRRGCYYLIANTVSSGYSAGVTPDRTYVNANGTADNGGIAILNAATTPVDQVGNGTSASSFGEGTRLPPFVASVISRSYERLASNVSGHVDTDDNASDFHLISPATPHNSNQANCLAPASLTVTGAALPTHAEQGQQVVVLATVTPATLPGSTNVQVTGNLSVIGGSASAVFADNGVTPDATANDNVFSAQVMVPQANPLGAQPIILTATDQEGRTATDTISVNVTLPAALYVPHEIQGAGAITPIALGEPVMVRGVVTGRSADGFFLQTETGMEDADPNTSEGLFVLAGGSYLADAQVGHLVYVKGLAAELVPESDVASPPFTAVNSVSLVFDLGESAMPSATELTSTALSEAGALDQLERFEGMRVHVASLMAVSGTGVDGVFYAVLTGQARPFREAGVESGYPLLACAAAPCHVPVFDGNPERLRVDSDGLDGVTGVNVSTGAVMDDVTGPLGFESRTFTILPEATLIPTGGTSMTAAPPATSNQFTVASMSLGGPMNDDRLAKASSMVLNVLNTPDILGVDDAEHFAALIQLAQAIDADAVAAGQPPPHYEAQPYDGSGPAGPGVLVKKADARVTPISTEPVGTDSLFEHPSIMLRATVSGPSTALPQNVTVIVNHLLAREGSELDDAGGDAVREQRKAQAEFLASFIQSRQGNDPGEAIVLLGGHNAFAFNDGYVDSLGTITGNPAAADQVAMSSSDLVTPDLVNLSELANPWDRYSSIANGNAQALDHVLATANLLSQFAGSLRPRVNADFPAVLAVDSTTPGRLSDRDPVVAYFTFPPDVLAPVLTVAGDRTAEATGPDGAMVMFDTPTATDDLDAFVAVTCMPASGSVFPLGNSGVTCTAQDVAGNVSTASFTVRVLDTTRPALALPQAITDEATSPDGRLIVFTVTASDAVTASPAVSCTPASGSTFAIGDTVVTCVAADAAGNVATGSFRVSITPQEQQQPQEEPVWGRMAGSGDVESGNERVRFTFDVEKRANGTERGRVTLQLRDGPGRPDRYLAADVSEVRFSNSNGYALATSKRTAADSVFFAGVGWWNGKPGYRFEISACDRGEPGRGRDTFSLTVFGPGGNVVSHTEGVLRTGNIQAMK
jgi:predicted extracellular nuclease